MNINATIFVQVFNFFIAYIMFRYILFKPASIVLEQEKKDLDYLDNLIEQDNAHVVQRTAEREAQWDSVRDYFSKTSSQPSQGRDLIRGISPFAPYKSVSDEAIKQVSLEAASQIVQAIEECNDRN